MTEEEKAPSLPTRAYRYYRNKGVRALFQRIARAFQEWNLAGRIGSQFPRIRRRSRDDFSAAPILSRREETALIFLHIPRTAGTSVRALVEPHFAEKERLYLYNEPWGLTLDAFQELPDEEKARFRFIAGHLNYGFHDRLPQPARYITVLRDPVDRVISLYQFIKSTPGNKQYHIITENNLSFEDFVFSGLIPKTDNGMVRNIAGIEGIRFGDCTNAVLNTAYRNIETHFDCVITMDHMQRGIARLGEMLEIPVRGMRKMNVSQAPKQSIDPALLKKIDAFNRLDRALYERFSREWEK